MLGNFDVDDNNFRANFLETHPISASIGHVKCYTLEDLVMYLSRNVLVSINEIYKSTNDTNASSLLQQPCGDDEVVGSAIVL